MPPIPPFKREPFAPPRATGKWIKPPKDRLDGNRLSWQHGFLRSSEVRLCILAEKNRGKTGDVKRVVKEGESKGLRGFPNIPLGFPNLP